MSSPIVWIGWTYAAAASAGGVGLLLRPVWQPGWNRWKSWRAARRAILLHQLAAADLDRISPLAFEHHCAEVLRLQGWRCRTTKASGDFGVDVLAERQGLKVAIQVKKWRGRVDLSAVQQAATGAAMYGASAAAVVSVSGYQPSAVRLARANRVVLLSYNDLFDFTRQGPSARR